MSDRELVELYVKLNPIAAAVGAPPPIVERAVKRLQAEDERRARAKQVAQAVGHPEWNNVCRECGCELKGFTSELCSDCGLRWLAR